MTTLKPYPAYRESGAVWLGNIPIHWEVRRLKSLAQIMTSGAWGSDIESEMLDQCLVATTAQMRDDGTLNHHKLNKRFLTIDEQRRSRLESGDILVSKSSGSIDNVITGKSVIVESEDNRVFFSNFLLALR